MRNHKTRKTTIKQVMSSAAFLKGFYDFRDKNGWHEPREWLDQWRYERGRMFAAFLSSCGINLYQYPLKAGRWATDGAVKRYAAAQKEGAVI